MCVLKLDLDIIKMDVCTQSWLRYYKDVCVHSKLAQIL